MKVRVDTAACPGHGRCYSLAPDVFESDDVGHCIVVAPEPDAALHEQARTGAANCPEQAITVDD